MANPADILSAFADDEELMDRLERAVFSSADDYMNSLSGALDDAISSLLTDDDGLVRPNKENARVIREIERQIDDILESNGMSKAEREILDTYSKRLDTADDLVRKAGIEGARDIDFRNMPEIQEQLNQFVNSLNDASPEVAQIVRNEMMLFRNDLESGSAVRFKQLKDVLIKKAGIMPRYAGTVGNTQLASLDRTARFMQADKAGIEKMKYMGVLDGLTRPFCRDHVGEVRTIDEWRRMKNNVNPQPVLKYCGGWNCRHRLIMWRDEWDE